MVTSPQGDLTPYGIIPRYQRFRVVGIFHSGFYQYDSSFGFIRLSGCAAFVWRAGPDLDHLFRVDDLYKANTIGEAIEKAAGPGLYDDQLDGAESRAVPGDEAGAGCDVHRDGADCVRGGAEYSDRADHDGDGEDQRHRRVDVFGVQPGQVRRIFLLQGLLICVIGTAIGLVLGYALAWAGGHYRFIHLQADVYSIDYLPFAPRVMHGVLVTALSWGFRCWLRFILRARRRGFCRRRRCGMSRRQLVKRVKCDRGSEWNSDLNANTPNQRPVACNSFRTSFLFCGVKFRARFLPR